MPFLTRKEPFYALCGLNCCLCPRFNTDGASKCPGCGGKDFKEKHPACTVMSCSIKHGSIEYCFECPEYPCKKYEKRSEKDSFASYDKVLDNFKEAKANLNKYLGELKEKYKYLQILIEKYNDGRSKTFFCVVVNNMAYADLCVIMNEILSDKELQKMETKERGKETVRRIKEWADKLGVVYELRK
jgi:hypothetical protein